MTKNFNTILVAPLDWGLGHATRCIPIISYLLVKRCRVILAADGLQKTLLQQEFPQLEILTLPGYRVKYAKSKRLFAFKIIQQIPTIINTISTENKWLQNVLNKYKIDAVISDNRYGLCNHNIHSIFVTHQLNIQTPLGLFTNILRWVNYKKINCFNECWVPDAGSELNIAGKLSHPKQLPAIPTRFIGPISRFEKTEYKLYKYKLLVVLSGPEPQRTLLEQKMLSELTTFNSGTLLVRGLPGRQEEIESFNNVTIVNHLNAPQLAQAFNESEFIISRSGYTTLMDIIKLNKKSILIPTPGQSEQEYLARHLKKQKWAYTVEQARFKLTNTMAAAEDFSYQLPNINMETYKTVIDDFIQNLQTK